MTGKRIFEKERVSVVWAAFRDCNFGGMLENSFEHSEIRIAFQQAASEVTIYSALHSVPSKVQHCHSTLGHSPQICKEIPTKLVYSKKIQYFCAVKLLIFDEISFC